MLSFNRAFNTSDRWQSKMLIYIINKRRAKIVRNRVFDYLLSSDWRQMAIKNTVSGDFLFAFVDF